MRKCGQYPALAELTHIPSPTLEQFAEASAICEIRWPYMKELNSRTRFLGFQKAGVQLVVASENGKMEGVCFVLPAECQIQGQPFSWVFLFQLATIPGSNSGGVLMLRIMKLFPVIVSMGVTEDAERMYKVLRWKKYEQVWRGVHPIRLNRLMEDYGNRLQSAWLRRLLPACSGLYHVFSLALERLLSLGVNIRPPTVGMSPRLDVVSEYLACRHAGNGPKALLVADAGGIGRLAGIRPGLGQWRLHAAMWRWLRARNAKMCEVLLLSEHDKLAASRLGYVPLPMSTWLWDPGQKAAALLQHWQASGFSFLQTDKIL